MKTYKVNKNLILALCASLCLALSFSAAEAADYKVIVNKGNSVSSLSKAELRKYFLKKKSSWESGEKVQPVDQKSDASVRESFSEDALDKSVGAVKAYWQQQIFSGRNVPPPEVGSDADVIDYVSSNPGAIGYVAAGADTSKVKVISVSK